MSKMQICAIFWVENGPQILHHVQGRVFIVEMVYPNGSIGKFLGFFLMDTLFSQIWTICKLPIFNSETQSGRIRKFPGNFLMHPGVSDPGSIRQFPRNFLMRTWVSDPEPIRKFLRNFLMRSRKKFKLFFQPASQPEQRAQARAHGPGPDPGPMGHGPGPWARARAHGPGHHFGGRECGRL